MGDQDSLSKPLLRSTTATTTIGSPQNDDAATSTTSSSGGIVLRLVFLSFVAALAVWASHEASKGFDVSIVNALPRGSKAGQRFNLFYVSNDKATRVLLNASDFVEDLLYGGGGDPGGALKKPVSHVTLLLSGRRFPGGVSVRPSGEGSGGFVVDVGAEAMDADDVDAAVKSAILRGMARVWLWDGEGSAPDEILSGVVEYIAGAAGFGRDKVYGIRDRQALMTIGYGDQDRDWFVDKDPGFVARVLGQCEEKEGGFIRRLNGAMRDRWHPRTVDDALGKWAQRCLCVLDN